MMLFSLKRLVIGALLLALLPASTNTSAQGDDWPAWMTGTKGSKEFDAQLSMARLNERHGQHDAAMKIYNSVLSKQPNNQLAHHRLAVIAASNGDFATADKHFSNALKAGPRSADLLGDVGYSLFLQNRLDDAEEALRRTLSEFPTHKKAHNTLGMVLGLKGRYEEALSEFRQVVGEDEAHANLAFVMVQAGNLEQAARHYHEAVRLNPALRPAAEALVQLNAYAPGDNSNTSDAPQAAEPAGKSDAVTKSGKASPAMASSAKSPTSQRPMAKPATTSQKTFSPAQPQSQQPASNTFQANAAKTEPGQATENLNKSWRQSNPTSEVAKAFVPPTPVVATQSEASFAPAVMGLAKSDRLSPGTQDSSTATSLAKAKQKRATELFAAAAERNITPTNTEASTDSQQNLTIASDEGSRPSDLGNEHSNAEPAVRAQVTNYANPEISQVTVSDDSAASNFEPAGIEITDADSAIEDITASAPAVAFAPSANALAAARAQANRLAEFNTTAMAEEPGMVLTADIQPIPLPASAEFETTTQAEPIPVEDFATGNTASPVGFVVASEEDSPPPAEISDSEISAKTTPTIIASINSLLEGNPPTPWQIVAMTLAGTFCLVTLGKTAKRLTRRRTKVESRATEPSKSTEEAPAQQDDVEETYTYLESQIRDVCAGLPAGRKSTNQIRNS